MALKRHKVRFSHIRFTVFSFRNYLSHIEHNFQDNILKLDEEFKALAASKPDGDDDPEGYYYNHEDYLIDQAHEQRQFTRRFRESIILQLYAFVDAEFKWFCSYYGEKHGHEFNVKTAVGKDDLAKYRRYLAANMPLNTAPVSKAYQFLNHLRQVRNQLAHHSGFIEATDGNYDSISSFAKGRFTLEPRSGRDMYEIILDKPSFLEDCIDEVENFFKRLVDGDLVS